jgi:hypothetical protein
MHSEPSADDVVAVTATLMDYFQGWFDGDAARMRSALHPELAKRGVEDDTVGQELESITAQQMIGWTGDGAGVRQRPTDLQITVEVLDVYRQIATALVRSTVYVEYAHLMRTSQGWKIVNTIYVRTSPGADA